ncbi:MAG: hypothetical protein HW387_53 [Parachlamydiales bacterium]|nr:hypothetical protein [Parachlamydiales bacterium]
MEVLMIRLINATYSSSLARLGSFSGSSRLQSMLQCSRRMNAATLKKANGFTETAPKDNVVRRHPRRITLSSVQRATTVNSPAGGFTAGPWDVNNRIRVVGATLGLAGASGMLFDTFYRRVTKQELNQAMEKLDAKIDRGMEKLDAKIDGLTNALLHTNQRDKIAAETENRELRKEIERLKSKGEGTKTVRP